MQTDQPPSVIAQHITITGVVQGVGFRPFVYNLAMRIGLSGWVLNHSGGVDIEVEGPAEQVTAFLEDLPAKVPPLARVASVDAHPVPPRGYAGFEIRHSESQADRYQLISPDVATCPDCLRELFDPADRRYRYPFTNCTNCGPRFTIIDDIPYDRPNTTMRVFPMCPDCQREYDDPANRRFHAQPNACPVCGPQIWLVEDGGTGATGKSVGKAGEQARGGDGGGRPSAGREPGPESLSGEAALARAVQLLREGGILAVKGLGGFQLACDATNAEAVARLRERKRRPAKPFALMVATLEDARRLAAVPPEAETLLPSPQSPIVLLDARSDSPVTAGVAPNSRILGLMLPYTPLHHILLRDVGCPLVMTSGNLSEEPIAKDNDEALRRLAPLADAFLLHNRDIHARYDDSVVQLMGIEEPRTSESPNRQISERGGQRAAAELEADSLQVMRRARGYAPFPVRLPFSGPQVYAAGPLLKNTFTLTRDDYAFVSQHIGDLENLETLDHYQAALATYQRLFRIEPECVVCDLHPDYMSTRLAIDFAREHRLPMPRRIQHHEAHIAACLADNGRPADVGPVIGVALDGTGYGSDGTIWGGEWLVGDYRGFRRAAHLEVLPLPGGDSAIHHPWRIAAAYLHALELDERWPLGEFCPADVMRVRTMVDRRLNTPLTSSMGRLFDAVSALLGICHEASYEAQAAIELEQVVPSARAAAGSEVSPYLFSLDAPIGSSIPNSGFSDSLILDSPILDSPIPTTPLQIGVAPLFDAILDDLDRGSSPADIALRFHVTVASMVVTVCERLRESTAIDTVALSGGVFQNRLLLTHSVTGLRRAGFQVLTHYQVPPNDGGVSLGQAAMGLFGN